MAQTCVNATAKQRPNDGIRIQAGLIASASVHDSSQSVASSAKYVSVGLYCWNSIKLVFDSFKLEVTEH